MAPILHKRLEFTTPSLTAGTKATIAVSAILLVAFFVSLGFFIWKYYKSSREPQPAWIGPDAFNPALDPTTTLCEKPSQVSSSNTSTTGTDSDSPTPKPVVTLPPPVIVTDTTARGRRVSVPRLNLVIDTPPASAETVTPRSGKEGEKKGWTTVALKVHRRNESAQSDHSIDVPPTPSRGFV